MTVTRAGGVADDFQITIPGVGSFPASALQEIALLVPLAISGIREGKSPAEVEADLRAAAPVVILDTAEAILNILFPGTGTLLGLLVLIASHAETMTVAEQIEWQNKTTAYLSDSRSGSG